MKWFEYKQKHADWDYSSGEHESLEILEKNKKIWANIGKSVCEHYTKNGNTIIYSEWKDDTYFVPKIHLILLLDDSGSMQGTPWNQLIEAVKSTFIMILNNSTLKNTIKVTVFNHASDTKNCFTQRIVDLSLVDQIIFRGGGTNFEYALTAGYNAILESQNQFDIFLVAFMSDGCYSYPKNIIDTIKKDDKRIKDKIKFNCIMFGRDSSGIDIHKKIANDLNGKFSNAVTLDELEKSFKEVINEGFK